MAVTPLSDERQPFGAPTPLIERAELTRVVRRALESDSAEVAGWEVHPLNYDFTSPISAGIYRVAGRAKDAGRRVASSLVLKAVRSAAGATMPNGEVVPRDLPDGPSFFGYWKREPLAYGADLLSELPGSPTAPRCYGLSERTDGTIWLWLEVVGRGRLTKSAQSYCQ